MITTIEGNSNSQKVLVLAKLVTDRQETTGREVYGFNCPFSFKFKKFSLEELFILSSKGKLENIIVAINEGYALIDSRNSASKVNKAMSYLAYASHRKEMDLFIATDRISSIDKRIRISTDFRVIVNSKGQDLLYVRWINLHNARRGSNHELKISDLEPLVSIVVVPPKEEESFFIRSLNLTETVVERGEGAEGEVDTEEPYETLRGSRYDIEDLLE